MKRLVIRTLCALTVAAILYPAVCHANDESATGEDAQPVFIPQLVSPVPVNFEDNPFDKVVTYFQNTTGFPIDVDWQELEKWDVSKETLISFSLSNIPSGRAIELMLVVAAGSRLALLLDSGEKLHITMRRKAARLIETDPDRWSYWRATPRPHEEGEPSPQEVAVAKMGETIPWNFDKNKIYNIFEYLRHVSNLNLFVDWAALKRVGVEVDTLVTAKGEPTAASNVLDAALATTGDDLTWRVDDFGIVIISTRDVIDQMFPAKDEAVDTEADGGE